MKKRNHIGRVILLAVLSAALALTTGCQKKEKDTGSFSIAVFVPGVVDGSPTYEMLVQGVTKAVSEFPKAKSKVVEGGTNQADWQDKIISLAASGGYDLIITSNPAMPAICGEVGKMYPLQRFMILDGYWEGSDRIYTFRYNQAEQGFLNGYAAGLLTVSKLAGMNDEAKVGMIVGQEYPDMLRAIRPGFELGINAAADGAKLDFRVVGNWYDASKAAELAAGMYDSGVDIILCIAGGANQGVISAAREKGKYVMWFDTNAYKEEPGVILGCTGIKQDFIAYEKTKTAIEGTLQYGTAENGGVREGAVFFFDEDPLFMEYVPPEIRSKITAKVGELREGKFELTTPAGL